MNFSTIPLMVYTSYITKLTPALCNYSYTCSQYSKDAILQHGLLDGVILTQRRLKKCSTDGQQLRTNFNITQKHFCKGSIVTTKYQPVSQEEIYQLIKSILILVGTVVIIGVTFYFQPIAIELTLAIAYIVLLIYKLYAERMSIIIKLNWNLILLGLLPALVISAPSMIITSALKYWFEPNYLTQKVIGEQSNKILQILYSSLLLLGLIASAFSIPFAFILILSSMFLSSEIKPSSTDRILDNNSIACSACAASVAIYNPTYSLFFVALWWLIKISK